MIIYVKVKPGSKKYLLQKVSENEYVVNIMERAVDGRANLALIKILAKEFKVLHNNIFIKNSKGRRKIIEIALL